MGFKRQHGVTASLNGLLSAAPPRKTGGWGGGLVVGGSD